MKIRKAGKKDLKEISKILRKESGKKPYTEKWTDKTAFAKINELFKIYEIYITMVSGKIWSRRF